MSKKNKQPKIETPIIESESVSQVPSFIKESSEVSPEVESDQVLSTQSVEKVTEKVEDDVEQPNTDELPVEPVKSNLVEPIKREEIISDEAMEAPAKLAEEFKKLSEYVQKIKEECSNALLKIRSDFESILGSVDKENPEQKGDAEPTSMPVPQPVKRDRLSFSDMLRNRRKPK
jgi:hypothetical protein